MPGFREAKDRIENYRTSVIPEVLKLKFERRKQEMKKLQEKTQSVIVDFEKRVRALLDSEGIPAGFRVQYLNFFRTLIKARLRYGCRVLRKVALVERAKFIQYGLEPHILDEIVRITIPERGVMRLDSGRLDVDCLG